MKKTCSFGSILLAVFLGAGLLAGTPSVGHAAGYPDRPIQLIIPNVAGAQSDIAARRLAAEMEGILNAKIIPNNKPGASTVLATDYVARARNRIYITRLPERSSGVTQGEVDPVILLY